MDYSQRCQLIPKESYLLWNCFHSYPVTLKLWFCLVSFLLFSSCWSRSGGLCKVLNPTQKWKSCHASRDVSVLSSIPSFAGINNAPLFLFPLVFGSFMLYFWFHGFFINFKKQLYLSINNYKSPYSPARLWHYFLVSSLAPQPLWSQLLKWYSSLQFGLPQWILPASSLRDLFEVISPQMKTLSSFP